MNGNTSTSSDNCHNENDSVPIVSAPFKRTKTQIIFSETECQPREIREEVLAGFEPSPPEPLKIEDEVKQEEPQPNVPKLEDWILELLERPPSWGCTKQRPTVKANQRATAGRKQKVAARKKCKIETAAQNPKGAEINGENEENSEPKVENNNEAAAEEIPNEMEQKLLSFFTQWNTHKSNSYLCGYLDLDLGTLIPRLLIKLSPPNSEGKRFVDLANSVISPANGVGVPTEYYSKLVSSPGMSEKGYQNPFPSSSLRFGMKPSRNCFAGFPKDTVEHEIYSIFKNYGHLLTILVLDDYWVDASKFGELFSHLPKLKSLSLERVRFIGCNSFNWSVSTLPPLQHLTHFSYCVDEYYGSNRALNSEPLLWLLEKYGSQLIGLTVSGRPYLSSEYVQNLEKTIQFEKLKQIKVNCNSTAVLELTREAKLSHIMVERLDGYGIFLPEMLPLVENFSKTLEYLQLPIEIGVFEQNDGAIGDFPKLKELSIKASSEFFGLENLLQSRFHELEELQFILDVEICPAVECDLKVAQYCKFLPKLKTITCFDDRPKSKSHKSIHARTHVVWSGNRSEELLLPNNILGTNQNCVTGDD